MTVEEPTTSIFCLFNAGRELACCAVRSEQMMTTSATVLIKAEDIAVAMQAGELVPFYQPLWDVNLNQREGVETLLRWQHPLIGLIGPDAFIPVTERSGLILELGNNLLRAACQQMQHWRDHCLPHGIVAVNVSALQFEQSNFVAQLEQILCETKLPPSALELELTETLVHQCSPMLIQNMLRCRALGIRLSIDDFGTGSASSVRLQCCPVTRLKIDKSFVANMIYINKDNAIAKSIIALGHSLGLTIVAEGVETAGQQQRLEQMGCDGSQGYHLAIPANADQVEALWSSTVLTV